MENGKEERMERAATEEVACDSLGFIASRVVARCGCTLCITWGADLDAACTVSRRGGADLDAVSVVHLEHTLHPAPCKAAANPRGCAPEARYNALTVAFRDT
eukprot:77440-Rhodomonas_salina.1